MQLKTLVVDDEPLARESILALLEQDNEIDIVAQAGNVKDAIKILKEKEIDLLFLDIRLPDGNGFEVIHHTDGPLPIAVFVTAYDQFALKAFEEKGLDYILKPFSRDRLYQAVSRAKAQFKLIHNLEGAEAKVEGDESIEHIMIKDRDRIFFLEPQDIEYIEGANYYSILHTQAKSHMLRESLQSLEEKLQVHHFRRVHRSYLINVKCMDFLQKDERGAYQVVLKNKKVLPMGPKYQDNIMGKR